MNARPQLWMVGGKDGPVPARDISDWGADIAERESELEAAYADHLTRGGASVQRQVRMPGVGIADIVTDDAAIEVKLWLTRAALFSAIGQATAYATVLGKARRVVFGYETGVPGELLDAIQQAGIEVVSWTAAGGPNWVDYTDMVDDDDGEAFETDEDWFGGGDE